MARLAFKDPDNAATITLNYANQLATGVTVSSSSWVISTGITEDTASFSSSTTGITVSGGTDGTTYELINTVTLSAGDPLDAAVYLSVGEIVLTEPAESPVSLGELKHYLRVTTDDDDVNIRHLLAASISYVESVTDRTLIDKTYTVRCRKFGYGGFQLEKLPTRALARVRYYDADNAIQTLDPATYTVWEDPTTGLSHVDLASGQSWPSVATRDDAIELLFIAGYGVDADSVPDLAKLAVKEQAFKWYERDAWTNIREQSLQAILWNLKTGTYSGV